jgi:hypothetical protein
MPVRFRRVDGIFREADRRAGVVAVGREAREKERRCRREVSWP